MKLLITVLMVGMTSCSTVPTNTLPPRDWGLKPGDVFYPRFSSVDWLGNQKGTCVWDAAYSWEHLVCYW
jgi:hypothetical protein